MAAKNGRKTIFGKSPVESADGLWVKNFIEIVLSRTVSKINTILHFTQRFKMATKNGKRFRGQLASRLYIYPVGQKILLKSLYLAPFPR